MKNEADIPGELESVSPPDSAPLDGGWRKKLQSDRVARAIPRLTDRRSLPLSFAQERLWLLERLEPGSPAYNRPLALRLTGLLDESALRHALQAIVDRHEVLRTRFTTRDGQPEQVISPSHLLDLHVIEHCAAGPIEREAQARRLATEESLRPFDLAQAPLVRATLLRYGSEDHVLLLVFHHMVFDGWSARVFRGEFASLYRKFLAGEPQVLPELPIQYADFAHWQRQTTGEQTRLNLLKYWVSQLSGSVPLDLPTDRPRPSVQTHRSGCVEIILSESFANSLKALGRKENATLFMVLLATFQSLLARYTGLEDISVGVRWLAATGWRPKA